VLTFHRSELPVGVLEDAMVRKRVLPLFVIAQIRAVVDFSDANKKPPVNPIVEAAKVLRAQIEPNFLSRDTPFACERLLLE
jgi:hypothetical protein